jgi:hypothetical protein
MVSIAMEDAKAHGFGFALFAWRKRGAEKNNENTVEIVKKLTHRQE